MPDATTPATDLRPGRPPAAAASSAGPREAAAAASHASVIWITSGGCDGCTMSVLGAVSPAIEDLLGGELTDIPSIELVHPVLSLESGTRYLASLEAAARGDQEGFLLVVEGSLFDNRLAGEGSFSGLGEREGQPIPAEEWVGRLAHRAQAVIAIGTILRGRDPLDAIDISSRACGVCGGVHSTCSAMALEMTFGVAPPPLAIAARNLAAGAEFIYDHCLHLFLLAGPDYSEAMVRRTDPALWKRAERTPAARSDVHRLRTIADIMSGLNPLSGALYREALAATRSGREIASLILGKYPHPSTIVPAGLGVTLDQPLLNQVLARVVALRDYVKRVVAVWEDLVEFFYEARPRYREVGARRANLVTTGMWDDPESYDAAYVNADLWGSRRLSTPGAVIDGELRTFSLHQVDLGIEEFVDHSFYEQWADGSSPPGVAPDGSPLSPHHPWNKETLPRPESRSWKERYSWSTAPRWDREPMESGPLARQWVTAAAGLVDTEFLSSGDGRLEILIPEGDLPETVVEWRVPGRVNALERNRARAVQVAYSLAACYSSLASPRDPWGVAGPYEEAVMNTPILEQTRASEEFDGIDILRAIRSFDPCLPCTVHMHSGAGTLVRDATTCACGQE